LGASIQVRAVLFLEAVIGKRAEKLWTRFSLPWG